MMTEVPEQAAPVSELDLGYQVSIEAFSGPMDLLLYLVRQAQVDIADIPIATIADQFVATIATWTAIDLDTAGDFILMAATLLEIKSRLVAPPRDESEDADSDDDGLQLDPRAGLIQQLLAYRRFKEATLLLDQLEAEAICCCVRLVREAIPEDPDEVDGLTLDNADPVALFDAFEVIQARIAGLGPRTVVYDDEPMEARMATVTTSVQAAGTTTLRALWQPLGHRVQQAGMLIAVLECTRQRFVTIDQLEQFGEITLRFRPEDQRAIAESLPDEPAEPIRKRRRRPPLVTFQVPAAPDTDAEADDDLSEDEAVVETDEQRFLRELDEACQLDEVLQRGADLDASFQDFLAARAAAASDAETASVEDPAAVAVVEASEGSVTSEASEVDDGGPRQTV